MTTVVMIGNSDDKLTQKEWSEFWSETDRLIFRNCSQIYFVGTSDSVSQFQNACWVFSSSGGMENSLIGGLESLRVKYRQDSIAIVDGETQWLKGKP